MLFLSLFACKDAPTPDTGAACAETTWYLDADGDGFGGAETVEACEAPAGATAEFLDCDDQDPSIHPDADEVCDGVDQDCDGSVDNDPIDPGTFYADLDGDGYGDPTTLVEACEAGDGASLDNTDCDDTQATVFPGADEICDEMDNDCDGETDGALYPGDFSSLSEAVSSLDPGALLCIAPGDYDEALSLSERTLRVGGFGPDQTRLLGYSGEGTGGAIHAAYLAAADRAELFDLEVRGLRVNASEEVRVRNVRVAGNECVQQCEVVSLYGGSEARFEDVEVTGNSQLASDSIHNTFGSLVFVDDDTTLSWTGGSIHDNRVEAGAATRTTMTSLGLVTIEGVLEMTGVSIHDNTMALGLFNFSGWNIGMSTYGLLTSWWGDITLTDVDFIDNEVVCLGESASGSASVSCTGLLTVYNGTASVTGGALRGNYVDTFSTGSAGGALATIQTDSPFTFQGVAIHDNELLVAGGNVSGVGLSWVGGGSLSGLDVRENRVAIDGGYGTAEGLFSLDSGEITLSNSVFAGNELEASYIAQGLITMATSATPTIANNTFHKNKLEADAAYAGVLYRQGSGAYTIVNNSVSQNQLGTDLTTHPAACVLYAYGISGVSYNALYGNSCTTNVQVQDHASSRDLIGVDGNDALTPAYTDDQADSALDWDLHPAGDSQLIDAGSPDITDTDGSRSDIGFTGGPGAG